MKYAIQYSVSALEKLKDLKKHLTEQYGKDVAKRVISTITNAIRCLEKTPFLGASLESLWGIPTPYRVFYVAKNYILYRFENNTVWITEIINEREDLAKRVFGIK